jgi:hypothetical protein
MRADRADAALVDVRGAAAPRYAPRGVTHDDLHALLPRYAAGELDERDAIVVRAHLASGCTACLDAVFRPHPPSSGNARPAAAVALPGSAPPARAARRLAIGLGVVALVLAVASGWLLARLRVRDGERRSAIERAAAAAARAEEGLAAASRAREELEARLRAAEAARTQGAAEAAAAAAEAAAARAAVDAGAEDAGRRLAEAEERVGRLGRALRAREAEIRRLLAGAELPALGDLAATPGVQVLHLAAPDGLPGARGHALWHPARDRIVLWVFDLPTPARYRVRVRLDDGMTAAGPLLGMRPDGQAATVIELGVRAARLRRLEVVREPHDVRVLEGRLPADGS